MRFAINSNADLQLARWFHFLNATPKINIDVSNNKKYDVSQSKMRQLLYDIRIVSVLNLWLSSTTHDTTLHSRMQTFDHVVFLKWNGVTRMWIVWLNHWYLPKNITSQRTSYYYHNVIRPRGANDCVYVLIRLYLSLAHIIIFGQIPHD